MSNDPSEECSACNSPMGSRQEALKCNSCHQWQHQYDDFIIF